jgi:hypothetical protein
LGLRFFWLVLAIALTAPVGSHAQYVGFGGVTNGASDCVGFETYRVTSLGDSGAGTFRDAVSQDCRLVLFDVAGTITLTQQLLMPRSYITVDGTSAPAPGITISAPNIRLAIEASSTLGDAHDIIIHHLRVVGAGGELEAADIFELDGQAAAVYNVVLDHITAVAASDGAFDVWGEVHDVTLSNNLVRDSIKAAHFSRPSQDRENFTIHRNVYARNNERQLRLRYNNRRIDFSNNVIYGWGWFEAGAAGLDLPSDPGYAPSLNIENNIYHYVSGFGTEDDAVKLESGSFPGAIFFAGNRLPPAENDAVSTSARVSIPGAAQVQKLDTSELADAVVLCAGTRYPTAEETLLLQQINSDLGGTGASSCQAPMPLVRPKPPAELTAS